MTPESLSVEALAVVVPVVEKPVLEARLPKMLVWRDDRSGDGKTEESYKSKDLGNQFCR